MKVSTFLVSMVLAFLSSACQQGKPNQAEQTNNQSFKQIAVDEYQRKVYASWLGQIVGNTYGLCYEFKFIDQPGPDSFPYAYTWTLDSLRKYNGAFSDDDTDIEYMYLTQMEKHGIEPTYGQLAEAWKTHVQTKVWCANRAAVTLMHAGHYPPITGAKEYNTQWCQIDPQLVNEIWAVTAPGMVDYAVDKSAFAAHITNDSFGIEPTLHYAAMYSAAFFETDIAKLIDLATAKIGAQSKFGKIVEHTKQLYAQYPNDWQSARKAIKDNYYVYADYNKQAWPVIDANLNGALGILALLYGQGDFQKTLDFSCAFGMDADNQAATMCGLLGIVNGLESIPKALLFPLPELNWTEPFNNNYKMITRVGLNDATISQQVERMVAQAKKIIVAKGGQVLQIDGKEFLQINEQATFSPPFELNPLPKLFAQVGRAFTYPIYTGTHGSATVKQLGDMPPGLTLTADTLVGTPTQAGQYSFQIIATNETDSKTIECVITIRSADIASSASEILFNTNATDKNIEVIRDGNVDKTYYSTKKSDEREVDFYGYKWDSPVSIRALTFNVGNPQEYCGWFTSFGVEYMQGGKWIQIPNPNFYPEMNLENNQWLKPSGLNYDISFEPIETKAIRIIGLSGGISKDPANAHLGLQYFTAISELDVHAQ